METFLDFMANLSTGEKAAWLFGWISIGLLMENLNPFSRKSYGKLKHNAVNLTFLLMTIIINLFFSLIIVKFLYPFINQNNIGFLNFITLPLWIELIIALLFFDFLAQFSVHYLLHKFKFAWRFHMIHHSDTIVTTTSGTRHHPLDYCTRELFSLLAICITGAPFAFYMVYRIITIPCTYFTHSNVQMPMWLDRALSYIIVTPNLHRFHHHYQLPYTDSNFGNILSVWDRIFGTFKYDDPKIIQYGLDILENTNDENILFQLGIPFNKNIPSTIDPKGF
jgi:sterol desaturase/sphingolipid hydroxylase (fatty acid hydroxylase superfamily)